MRIDGREYLRSILYQPQEVKDWLSGKAFPFAAYDSELGWLLKSSSFRDGIDGSVCVYTYADTGERVLVNHIDKPCRINSYGNSFTQCHQVNDGETWQEVLAAHIGEPVRNFGVGGYSVYQAYRRVLRQEASTPGEFIIFNIYSDDHYRNLDSWRNIRVRKHPGFIEPTLPHILVDVKTRQCRECENLCPTEPSLYALCDWDWVCEQFKDDLAMNVLLSHLNADEQNPEQGYGEAHDLASTFGIKARADSCPRFSLAGHKMHTEAALLASKHIIEMLEDYRVKQGKKILYVLTHSSVDIRRRVKYGIRCDQSFVNFLQQKGVSLVDMMAWHLNDFSQYKINIEEYLGRFYIGHYSPYGNFCLAFALKDKVVEMLKSMGS